MLLFIPSHFCVPRTLSPSQSGVSVIIVIALRRFLCQAQATPFALFLLTFPSHFLFRRYCSFSGDVNMGMDEALIMYQYSTVGFRADGDKTEPPSPVLAFDALSATWDFLDAEYS